MKIFFDVGYSTRGVAEVTATELEVFQRVLDKMHAAESYFYNTEDVVLAEKLQIHYSIKLVPAGVRVLTAAQARAEQPAEETANG